MNGDTFPARPERVIHRFRSWSLVPAQDLLTLRRSLLGSPAAEDCVTAASELLSIVEEEVGRRGLAGDDEVPDGPVRNRDH